MPGDRNLSMSLFAFDAATFLDNADFVIESRHRPKTHHGMVGRGAGRQIPLEHALVVVLRENIECIERRVHERVGLSNESGVN